MVRTQKEKWKGVEKTFTFLENTKIITYRIIEIRTLKDILVKAQIKIRNVIEQWRKGNSYYKLANNVTELFLLVFCGK